MDHLCHFVVVVSVGSSREAETRTPGHRRVGFIDEDWIDHGVGFHQFRDKFNGVEFRDNQWTANGGVGVRIPVAPNIFVSPELRLGFETFIRAAASVEFTF